MNTIFSIHKQYSDKIFDKTKPVEFRHKLPKLETGDKVYIYETKKGGCGQVVGYFTVKEIKPVQETSMASYMYAEKYAELFCDEETQKTVKKAMSIHLDEYDNSLVLCYLFMNECLNEMALSNRPPEESLNNMYKNMKNYEKQKKKKNEFLNACDNWLREIGFFDKNYNPMNWDYEIWVDEVKRFETPLPITEFLNKNGEAIQKAPQSFCYTNTDI